ncbi:hypothetical protein R3P38DRAFT_1927086 [Favolaschia claudopus]|uniref:Uncharacterized protein n=1 Tax=Favolaschia claudopus TaxID=2862362 RepID=A0AAW0A224_9AGAR
MGYPVYIKLVKVQEKIDAETRRTAFVPPEMSKDPSWECTNHASCLRAWPKIWFDQIGRQLLHPDKPLMLRHILPAVLQPGALKHAGFHEQCRQDMISKILTIKFADQTLVPLCASKVVEYFGKL